MIFVLPSFSMCACICVCESSAHFRSHVWGIRNRRCHICHSYKVRSTRQMICSTSPPPPPHAVPIEKGKRRKLFIENYGVMCSQNSTVPTLPTFPPSVVVTPYRVACAKPVASCEMLYEISTKIIKGKCFQLRENAAPPPLYVLPIDSHFHSCFAVLKSK